MAKERASYRKAVEWIAFNDDDSVYDLDTIQGSISVALVADVWNRLPIDVAQDVLCERERFYLGKET